MMSNATFWAHNSGVMDHQLWPQRSSFGPLSLEVSLVRLASWVLSWWVCTCLVLLGVMFTQPNLVLASSQSDALHSVLGV